MSLNYCKSCLVDDSPSILKRCVCRKVSYCSRECQKNDWSNHKTECPPFRVAIVGEKGRGLLSTRSLSQGVTALIESPVLTVNMITTDTDKLMKDFNHLPVKDREKVLHLYDYQSDDNQLLAKLSRIIDVNSIIICTQSHPSQTGTKNIYLTASLINHSCSPNLVWFPRGNDIVVKAVNKIKSSEELTISYLNCSIKEYKRGNSCLPGPERRSTIFSCFQFRCHCRTCLQEDEGDNLLRSEFQRLDKIMEEDIPQEDLFENTKTKLELAKIVGDPRIVFISLIDCWKISEFMVKQDLYSDSDKKVTDYRMKAEKYAKLLGPEAAEAFLKFDNLSV